MYHSITFRPADDLLGGHRIGISKTDLSGAAISAYSGSNAIENYYENYAPKNTFDDWHIVPQSRPVFNPPSLRKKSLEIPGVSSSIDLTEALTGYPTYENRSGSFEFLVLNDYWSWVTAYQTISAYLHGRRLIAILEDDPMYYYEGRFTVNSWKSEKNWSKIVIDYEVDPYKRSTVLSTDADWLWDPFNFETGEISASRYFGLRVNVSARTDTFQMGSYGSEPVCPTFVADLQANQKMAIKVKNPSLGIDETKTIQNTSSSAATIRVQYPEIVFWGYSLITVISYVDAGTASLSIEFREGRF